MVRFALEDPDLVAGGARAAGVVAAEGGLGVAGDPARHVLAHPRAQLPLRFPDKHATATANNLVHHPRRLERMEPVLGDGAEGGRDGGVGLSTT